VHDSPALQRLRGDSDVPAAPLPVNEQDRLAALRSYDALNTASEAAFDELVDLAAGLTGCPMAAVSLVDAERQWFKGKVGLDITETPRDQAFCAYAILEPGRPLVVPDATADARFADNPLVTGPLHTRFYAGVPLVNPDGHALGSLCVMDTVPRAMDPAQLETLKRLARAVSTTLELRRTALSARRLALTDHLTGIANRAAFLDMLERTIARQSRHGDNFALVCLDLDGFKAINDRHGHAEGDAVLRAVAAAMTGCVRREDLVARVGGDEFAAILAGGATGAAKAAERIRMTINRQMAEQGWDVTASVGSVTFGEAPSGTEEAMQMADRLMYAAKFAGKNRAIHADHAGHRSRVGEVA
jgi:diguanylate cyclase (GGDEF)-like protein